MRPGSTTPRRASPSQYFEESHEFSNIQDAERYLRVHRDASGPVHARDGPIASMGDLLESDRCGCRKVVQNDDQRERKVPGYDHTATLDVQNARDAQMTLRFDGADVSNTAKKIAKGFRVWKDAGMQEERFRQAKIRFSDGSVDQAWRYLNTG